MALPQAKADELLAALRSRGEEGVVVGKLTEGEPGAIAVV
jgi:hypothetical protein